MERREFLYGVGSLFLSSCVERTIIPPVHYHYASSAPAECPQLEQIIEQTPCPEKAPEQKQDSISPEYRALLDTIAWAEGTDCHYNMMVGRLLFRNYSSHPVETGEMPEKGFPFKTRGRKYWRINYSTAAGRYQFLYRTYNLLKERGFFQAGFIPEEQDQAALHLITESGITQGLLEEAIRKKDFINIWHELSGEWASLPHKKTKRSRYRSQFAYEDDKLKKMFFYFYEIRTQP